MGSVGRLGWDTSGDEGTSLFVRSSQYTYCVEQRSSVVTFPSKAKAMGPAKFRKTLSSCQDGRATNLCSRLPRKTQGTTRKSNMTHAGQRHRSFPSIKTNNLFPPITNALCKSGPIVEPQIRTYQARAILSQWVNIAYLARSGERTVTTR